MSYEAERAITKAALAEPGEWYTATDDDEDEIIRVLSRADLAHIATFNPEFCLGLLDKLEQIGSLFVCRSCGMTPNDSGWNWTNWDDPAYRGNHYHDGPMPDLCGPVELAALNPTEANND